VAKGAYVLADAADGKPEVILIGTGSEVSLCVAAYEQLTKEGVKARVVSLPSWDLFEKQSESYQNEVLPPSVGARVAVEQGSVFGWPRFTGPTGSIVGMRTFGASAPIKELQKKFGFTVENVINAARETMKRQPKK
jgi:transketolase